MDHEMYMPSVEELEKAQRLKDNVPIHVSVIRETVDSLSNQSLESLELQEQILDTLRKQEELLQSLDHFQYRVVPSQTVWLVRIFVLQLLLGLGVIAAVLLN